MIFRRQAGQRMPRLTLLLTSGEGSAPYSSFSALSKCSLIFDNNLSKCPFMFDYHCVQNQVSRVESLRRLILGASHIDSKRLFDRKKQRFGAAFCAFVTFYIQVRPHGRQIEGGQGHWDGDGVQRGGHLRPLLQQVKKISSSSSLIFFSGST